MAYTDILYDVTDAVATVTLNRPDRLNAWTATMEDEVRDAMAKAAGDDGVRVIILTGAGHGFCAGADMDLLNTIQRSEEHTSELQSLMRISYAVFCLKKKQNQITKIIS